MPLFNAFLPFDFAQILQFVNEFLRFVRLAEVRSLLLLKGALWGVVNPLKILLEFSKALLELVFKSHCGGPLL